MAEQPGTIQSDLHSWQREYLGEWVRPSRHERYLMPDRDGARDGSDCFIGEAGCQCRLHAVQETRDAEFRRRQEVINQTIADAQDLMARPRIFIDEAANIDPNVIRQVTRESGLDSRSRSISGRGLSDWIPPEPLRFSTNRRSQTEDNATEMTIRSYANAIQPVWNGVFSIGPEPQPRTNTWKLWSQLWDNLAVAHTASIEMKEVHYDAKSGTITNKAAICPWLKE